MSSDIKDVINKLTIYEMEPKDRPIRESPVVDWFSATYDFVPERNQVADRRTRADILQVRATRAPPASLSIYRHLFVRVVQVRVEVFYLYFICEVRSDGGIDAG